MTTHTFGPRFAFAVLAVSLAACSGSSPVTPSPSSPPGDLSAKGAPAVPGVYDLSFVVRRNGAYEEVSTLPVRSSDPKVRTEEMVLKAYVTDSSGVPAQKGAVTFQYCSYKNGPANDIDRADEAPKEACADGSASWARLATRTVSEGSCPGLGLGYACHLFGTVQIPRTVGFRIRYEPQGSGIAAGTTAPENFTWVAGS